MNDTPPKPPPKPSLHLNWEEWLPYLDDTEASDADKRQLIETLWAIVMAFVDLGWDLNAAPETCGQDLDLTAALRRAVLNSDLNGDGSTGPLLASLAGGQGAEAKPQTRNE